ncbi:MAG: AVAST type 4 anti-phage nuclease Avs4 [Candidatus Paceibacterota bacterium]
MKPNAKTKGRESSLGSPKAGQMQEINWGVFKAKFDGKESQAFERLCNLLFCAAYKKPHGIFQYKNQPGIETNPVKRGKKYIGWQAKFVERIEGGNLKRTLCDAIDKAKLRNPELTDVIIYLNHDFPPGRKTADPRYKKEIEEHALDQDVNLIWRTASYFNSPFVTCKNRTIAQHFFSLDKGIVDLIEELGNHTDRVLEPINSKIEFKTNEIKIDRLEIIETIRQACGKSSLLIISGKAGTGKTAVIKDFYGQVKDKVPFFLFKSSEFSELANVNQLFGNYGSATLADFIKEHESIDEKYVVIDSAEKLSDIDDQAVFQEMLSALLTANWKLIFTARYSYMEGLEFLFLQVCKVPFQTINIDNLNREELIALSTKYLFNLPDDDRLIELLQNPFYLNEYLRYYDILDSKDMTSFSNFKDVLWKRKISKVSYTKNNTHIKREECFLRIAKKRADGGSLFVTNTECEAGTLLKLQEDEIIQRDSSVGGYFITHDIYEEWALEKTVNREFQNASNYQRFFEAIGSSFPIRRALGRWLSDELLIDRDGLRRFIEDVILDQRIESYWRDEIIVSVLLSDYAEAFMEVFENKLLENNQDLLKRVVFLLRIACKAIDEDLLGLLGKRQDYSIQTLFTKPKGKGWQAVIAFIHAHKEELELQGINVILPLLDDWNRTNRKGKTTKFASKIGLHYYAQLTKDGRFLGDHDDNKTVLVRTILNGSAEITNELTAIFDEILSNNQTNYQDQYYQLVQTILVSPDDAIELIRTMPVYVIKLAELFWSKPPENDGFFGGGSPLDMEAYFGLSHSLHYFPASAYQTPTYFLLKSAPKETVDFIVSLANRAVEAYAKSGLDGEIQEVEVNINDNESVTQYISDRLWNTYRGTQVSSSLLESVHMALEKWLLENAAATSTEVLEGWCLYLLKNSKSSSITAILVSLVLANPDKLFEIATVLFRTKAFFVYDTHRMILDQTAESLYSIGAGVNYRHRLYEHERLKTCSQAHRKMSLEQVTLQYQFFKSEETSDAEAERRQEKLWSILDEFYTTLPDERNETESDKTWRLYLARMDRRKMNPKVEQQEEGLMISFNPEIDDDLKKFSEESVRKSAKAMKYSPLMSWSRAKFEGNDEASNHYSQYQDRPEQVISEVKEIVDRLKDDQDEEFYLFNHAIPAYACAVLIRDFWDDLNDEDKRICKETVIGFASIPLRTKSYHYQISDGVEPSIKILPNLIKRFPEDKDDVKILLLLLSLDSRRDVSTSAIGAIQNFLWRERFDEANSLFLGFLFLAPKYRTAWSEFRRVSFQDGKYEISEAQVLEKFYQDRESDIEKIIANGLAFEDITEIDNYELEILAKAFDFLPIEISNDDHEEFLDIVLPIFSKRLFVDKERDADLYETKMRFIEKFAYSVLNTSNRGKILARLKPFVDDFSGARDTELFFQRFISVENRVNKYEAFWIAWNSFYNKIIELVSQNKAYDKSEIVHSYLLAWPYWEDSAKQWHTLKDRERLFYKNIVNDIGYDVSVFSSIAQVLNEIGSDFIDDGIGWLSHIVKDARFDSRNLEINTIFYIENVVRRYILVKRQDIMASVKIKHDVVSILNFLIEQGSVTGYMLRDNIL